MDQSNQFALNPEKMFDLKEKYSSKSYRPEYILASLVHGTEESLERLRKFTKIDFALLPATAWQLLASSDRYVNSTKFVIEEMKLKLKNVKCCGNVHMLHNAVLGKAEKTVNLLLRNGFNVNVPDYIGDTPLHFAIDVGSVPIIKQLVDGKADINLQDREGLSALHFAAMKDNSSLPSVSVSSSKGVSIYSGLTRSLDVSKGYYVSLLKATKDDLNKTSSHTSSCSCGCEGSKMGSCYDIRKKGIFKEDNNPTVHAISPDPFIVMGKIIDLLERTDSSDEERAEAFLDIIDCVEEKFVSLNGEARSISLLVDILCINGGMKPMTNNSIKVIKSIKGSEEEKIDSKSNKIVKRVTVEMLESRIENLFKRHDNSSVLIMFYLQKIQLGLIPVRERRDYLEMIVRTAEINGDFSLRRQSYYLHAKELNRCNQTELAINALKKGLSLDPSSDQLIHLLHSIYIESHQYEEARKISWKCKSKDHAFELLACAYCYDETLSREEVEKFIEANEFYLGNDYETLLEKDMYKKDLLSVLRGKLFIAEYKKDCSECMSVAESILELNNNQCENKILDVVRITLHLLFGSKKFETACHWIERMLRKFSNLRELSERSVGLSYYFFLIMSFIDDELRDHWFKNILSLSEAILSDTGVSDSEIREVGKLTPFEQDQVHHACEIMGHVYIEDNLFEEARNLFKYLPPKKQDRLASLIKLQEAQNSDSESCDCENCQSERKDDEESSDDNEEESSEESEGEETKEYEETKESGEYVITTEDMDLKELELFFLNSYAEGDDCSWIDPKSVHAYFQWKKCQITTKSQKNVISWFVNGKRISENEVVKLKNRENFYVLISNDLKLDKSLFDNFDSALDKGLVKRQYNINGVKFINKYYAELKINSNTRLVSRVLYKNNNDQYLIIFDRILDHVNIKSKQYIKVIHC